MFVICCFSHCPLIKINLAAFAKSFWCLLLSHLQFQASLIQVVQIWLFLLLFSLFISPSVFFSNFFTTSSTVLISGVHDICPSSSCTIVFYQFIYFILIFFHFFWGFLLFSYIFLFDGSFYGFHFWLTSFVYFLHLSMIHLSSITAVLAGNTHVLQYRQNKLLHSLSFFSDFISLFAFHKVNLWY